MFRLTGTHHRVTSAYHSQANGEVERSNRSIKNALLKVLQDHVEEWPNVIPGVLFAQRSSIHRSTKYSPFYLLYGRHPRLPSANSFNPSARFEADESDEEEPFSKAQFQEVLEVINDFKGRIIKSATENIKDAQEQQKRGYNRRHSCGQVFQVGQLVFLINAKRRDRKGGKYQLPKSGPYKVLEINENKRVTLQNSDGVTLKTKYPLKDLVPVVCDAGEEREDAEKLDDDVGPKQEEEQVFVPVIAEETIEKAENKKDETAKGCQKKKDFGEDVHEEDNSEDNEEMIFVEENLEKSKCKFYPIGVSSQLALCKKLGLAFENQACDPKSKSNVLGNALTVEEIRGDGNCFFRALSYLLTGHQKWHGKIRKMLVMYMASEDFVRCFCPPTLSERLCSGKQDGGSGDLGHRCRKLRGSSLARHPHLRKLEGKVAAFQQHGVPVRLFE